MSNTNDELWPKIAECNARLLAAGPAAISVDSYTGYVGFDPQWTIDVVNEVIGTENWRYEEIEEGPVGADAWEFKALLYLRVNGEWLTKGSQVGGARTERNVTDGKKAARTDFLKKAFSAWSIGAPAYRGELKPSAKPTARPPATGTSVAHQDAQQRPLRDKLAQDASPAQNGRSTTTTLPSDTVMINGKPRCAQHPHIVAEVVDESAGYAMYGHRVDRNKWCDWRYVVASQEQA